jgi:hypothetical protein
VFFTLSIIFIFMYNVHILSFQFNSGVEYNATESTMVCQDFGHVLIQTIGLMLLRAENGNK